MSATQTRAAIDVVWRSESARLIGGILRIVRNLDQAEELAQDALLAALKQWPESGIPANPGGWLMAAAKHRAIDCLRRSRMLQRRHGDLARETDTNGSPDYEADMEDSVGDDLLRLMFIACHPVLTREGRVALTLRLLGGLSTQEIARAFLIPEATIAQRIVRAKRSLADARVPFETPRGGDLTERLPSVLEVVYLIFNEGYAATAGDDWTRPELCGEALRLGRILADVMPGESEAQGLVALMEIQASRLRARVGPAGEPVLLVDQDRTLWDGDLIRRGLARLEQARQLTGRPGPYLLQAAVAACHARAQSVQETDWERIADLYGELAKLTPSPVVELNRAVAVGMARGPGAALPIVDAVAANPLMREYHLLPSIRGDLLMKTGRFSEAAAELERASALAQNTRERDLLLARAEDCRRRTLS